MHGLHNVVKPFSFLYQIFCCSLSLSCLFICTFFFFSVSSGWKRVVKNLVTNVEGWFENHPIDLIISRYLHGWKIAMDINFRLLIMPSGWN